MPPLLAASLQKRSRIRRRWNSRFCVLRTNGIDYYKQIPTFIDDEDENCDVVCDGNIDFMHEKAEPSEARDHPYCIRIGSTLLSCNTHVEQQRWLSAIKILSADKQCPTNGLPPLGNSGKTAAALAGLGLICGGSAAAGAAAMSVGVGVGSTLHSAFIGGAAGATASVAARTLGKGKLWEARMPTAKGSARSSQKEGSSPDLLTCHAFFASPLCGEKKVTLSAAAELAAWGFEFDVARPNVLANILPGGLGDGKVQPGDELLYIANQSKWEHVHGTTPAMALRALLCRCNPKPDVVQLAFRIRRPLPQLRLADEISSLYKTGCEIVPRLATVPNIREMIAAAECRILHLSLHCTDKPYHLILENGFGTAKAVAPEELQDLFSRGQEEQHIRLVLLCSCHSLSLASSFVKAGVRHAVCIRDDAEVRDSSCMLFSQHMLLALRRGSSVQDAFACGKANLTCSGEHRQCQEAESFVLLPEGGDHREVFAPAAGLPVATPPLPIRGDLLPPPVENFVGREAVLADLLRIASPEGSARRFVELCGPPGIGKSAVLKEFARLEGRRREAFEEVHWLGLAEVENGRYIGDLSERLQASPYRRVLLLVDQEGACSRAQLEQVLRFAGVHVLVAITTSAEGAGDGKASSLEPAAIAWGLQACRVILGPLDDFAQVQLFLRSAQRPLFNHEVYDVVEDEPAKIVGVNFASPTELSAVAKGPLLRGHGGNPWQLVAAARKLTESTSPKSVCTFESNCSG